MQGIWQENLSGYDRKDNKRKKQTRKHLLKDKAKTLIRKFHYNENYNDVVKVDFQLEITPDEKIYKKSALVDISIVEFSNRTGKKYTSEGMFLWDTYSYTIKKAYTLGNKWFDYYSNEELKYHKQEVMRVVDKEEISFKTPILVKTIYTYLPSYDEQIFIYNKPISNNYWREFGFYSTKRRKYASNLANRNTRARMKTWLSKKDYDMDTEPKNHKLEKSISWELW